MSMYRTCNDDITFNCVDTEALHVRSIARTFSPDFIHQLLPSLTVTEALEVFRATIDINTDRKSKTMSASYSTKPPDVLTNPPTSVSFQDRLSHLAPSIYNLMLHSERSLHEAFGTTWLDGAQSIVLARDGICLPLWSKHLIQSIRGPLNRLLRWNEAEERLSPILGTTPISVSEELIV
ncbi:hypothetical protein OF83DRAFT_1175976 [Amylostereum chailletii]|nr:hypothetical protein OF83DRAFT_1175976 [Amylostereum chailletii]